MFSKKQAEAFRTGIYRCCVCGMPMMFEDEKERDVLICTNPECRYETDVDHYGLTDEEYDALYPTKEEILGYGEDEGNDSGETYDEVHGELDD